MARVLIAADDPDMGLFLQLTLEREGHTGVQADDWDTLVHLLDTEGWDTLVAHLNAAAWHRNEVGRDELLARPGLRVVIVSMHEVATMREDCPGADAYCRLDRLDDLCAALVA